IRMNAADTSASSAIADWTPLTVVSRSFTTAEIDTFISDVSTTRTNIAMDSSSARRPDLSVSIVGVSALTRTEDLDAPAATGLRAVHGRVGVAQQAVGAVTAERDPDARREATLDAGDLDGLG